MRPSTIRLASAASAVRRTLIPFASRAAAVRLTRASSPRVPNRRLIDRSRSRSEEHTSELQSLAYLVCRLLLEKKKNKGLYNPDHTPLRRLAKLRSGKLCQTAELVRWGA